MSRATIVPPSLVLYPERRSGPEPALQRLALTIEAALLARATRWRARGLAAIVDLVARERESIAALDDAGLKSAARAAGAELRRRPDWPVPWSRAPSR